MAGEPFLETLDHTLDDWRTGNFSWPENWTFGGSNVDEQNIKNNQTKHWDFDDEEIRARTAIADANSLIGKYDYNKSIGKYDSLKKPSLAQTYSQNMSSIGKGNDFSGANYDSLNKSTASLSNKGNTMSSLPKLGDYSNVYKNLNGLNKTSNSPYQGLRFQGFDKPMDLPKGSIEPGWLEGLDIDMSNFTFGGGADDDNTSWGSGGDDKTDWLGWSQVASGLGQAFANYRQSQAAMAKIPLLQDELNFRKASFKDQQGDKRLLHNNAINQQKGLLTSAFYNDPTRAASLRTLPA